MIGGVYLAYPIDQRDWPAASEVYMFDQIEWLKRELIASGLIGWVFDPGDAFTVSRGAQMDDSLPAINRAALNFSDLVVAFLPAKMATVGVPMEIDRARAQGKHVIVFSDAHSWMLELPHVHRFRNWREEDLMQAIGLVSEMEPPVRSRQFADLPFKVDVEGCLPKRTYDDDAGLDLIVSEDTLIPVGEFVDVPCGVSVQLPGHTWGLITGRSSALRTRGLLVTPGIIDAGYRGPLFAGAYALQHDVEVKAGERVAQLILIGNETRYHTPIPTEGLTQSMRGTNGFGSSGA